MVKCKCIKCRSLKEYPDFKKAWMDGWSFVKNADKINEDILGVCEECPALTEQEISEMN